MKDDWRLVINDSRSVNNDRRLVVDNRWSVDKNRSSVYNNVWSVVYLRWGMVDNRRPIDDYIFLLLTAFLSLSVMICFSRAFL